MRYSASSWSWPAVQAARKSNRLLCAMRLVNKGLAAASNAARTLHHPTLQPSAHLRFPAKLTSVIAVTLHRPPVENPLPEVDLTPPGKNFPHLAPVQSISIVRIVDVLLPWKIEDEDRFSQLPKDVLRRILELLSTGASSKAVNQAFLALRLASKGLAAIHDSSRTAITLHPGHLQDAISFLTKLTAVTAVTICAPLNSKNHYWCNTSPISTLFPHLTSLTFESSCIVNIPCAISPWKQCLKHLQLHNCTLCSSAPFDSWPAYQVSWSPDLPFLESLVIKAVALTSLNLAGCPLLSNLELNSCRDLQHVIGSPTAMAALHVVWESLQSAHVRSSKAQPPSAVNMSGCSALVSLKLRACDKITSLDVGGCSGLKYLDFSDNPDLSSVKFFGCEESLMSLTCTGTSSLRVLDTSSCSKLQVLVCADNKSLQLVLPGSGSSLRELRCLNNSGIATLHLSQCERLEQVVLYGNKGLATLRASGLRALTSVSCCECEALTTVEVVACGSLRNVVCERNAALFSLDLTGCTAIRTLFCRGNSNLSSLIF